MNKDRRRRLSDVQKRISELHTELQGAVAKFTEYAEAVGGFREELEGIRDEEDESFENMPDGLKEGERGQSAQEAISAMEEADGTLGEVEDALNGFETEVLDRLGEAAEKAAEAAGQ